MARTPDPEEQWQQRQRYMANQGNGHAEQEGNSEYDHDGNFVYPCLLKNGSTQIGLSSRTKRPYFTPEGGQSVYFWF